MRQLLYRLITLNELNVLNAFFSQLELEEELNRIQESEGAEQALVDTVEGLSKHQTFSHESRT